MAVQKENKNFWYYRKEIAVAVVVILVMIFFYQNSKDEVPFKIIFFTINMSPIVLALLFYGLGCLTIWIYFLLKSRDSKIELKSVKTELIKANSEIKKLMENAENETKSDAKDQ